MSALAIGPKARAVPPRLPHFSAAVTFPAFVVLAGFLVSIKPALDPDLGVHVRTGAAIAASHAIPHVDGFSHSLSGAPWADFEWLWEIGLTAISGIAGTMGLVIAHAVLTALALGLIYARLRLCGSAPLIATCGAALGLVNILPYADVRPGMVGFFFEALFLAVLELSRARRNWRWLLLLLPAELMWANAHGSYAAGPLLCGLYGIAAAWEELDHRRATRSSIQPALRCLMAWAGLCFGLFAVSVANPMGIGLLRFTLGAGHLSFNRTFIGEWRPPDFNSLGDLPLLASVVASIALPLLFGRARLGRREALLLAVCSLAALKSAQFLPLYAVAAAPLLTRLVQPSPARRFAATVTPLMATALAGCLVVLAALSWQAAAPQAAATAVARDYPVAAVRFIEDHQLQGPMWNEYGWGSYLIANLHRLPVFVDGRAEMYGDPFLKKYMDVLQGKTDPQPELDGYGINLVLIPPDTALATILRRDAGWDEAFHDDVASVFVRSGSAS
jgi:hypothetical protein